MRRNSRRESTECPRCGQKSDFANCTSCGFPKWHNPAKNTHNKMCKCTKCRTKHEEAQKAKKPRVRGK